MNNSLSVSDEIILISPAPGRDIRGTPHIAHGAGSYLAVWREGWNGEGGAARIFASRIDDAGKLLDPKPIEISPTAQGFQELPRVAFGGGVYLVVWQDFRDGKDYDILAARISPDGKVLDRNPISIAAAPRTQSCPDVASNGRDFLVAWQTIAGPENAFHIAASRISADGRVAAPIQLRSPWTRAASSPRLVWDGANYRITFISQSLLTTRVNPDGSTIDREPIVTLRGNLGAAIGFFHSAATAPDRRMLLVFPRSQPDYWGWGGPGAAICCLVGTDGKSDPTMPKESYPQSKLANWLDFGRDKKEGDPWPHGPCAVAWDGSHFIAVWQRQHIQKTVSFTNGDLLASRVDGWKPLDPAGIPIATSPLEERNPALASDGAGNLVCVYEKHDAEGQITLIARIMKSR